VVEVSDDSPPPGWDQWASWPTSSPEPQEGALVRRHEGHLVVGGRGHGAEASSSRAGRPAQVEGAVEDPPAFADARGEQELWSELRSHGATLNLALNEALRVHGGPAWLVFQVSRGRSSFSPFVFVHCIRVSVLTGFDSVIARSSSVVPTTSTTPSTG
jgi:hypothetical protein